MGSVIDRLAGPLLDASLAAAVWLGVVALVMVGCRQPVRRRTLARAALVGALALGPIVVLDARPRPVDAAGAVRRLLPLITRPQAHPPGRSAAPFNVAPTPWMGRALTVTYLAGASASLAALALGWGAAHLLIRGATAPSSRTAALYEALPFPSRRRPLLRVSPRTRRPVLVGVVRPTILIPPDLDRSGDADRVRLVLLHELAHAEQSDLWFGLVGALARAAWFFLPPMWWILLQLRLDQEFLADRRAASAFDRSCSYAASLVAIASDRHSATARHPSESPGGRGRSALFLRVLMLLRCPYPVEVRAPLGWRLGMVPLTVAGVLLASSLSLRGGARDAFHPSPASCAEFSHGQFHLARLILRDDNPHPEGPIRPYLLPPVLPPSFDLSLEAWSAPSDLTHLRIAGLQLLPESVEGTGWHHLRIRRTPGRSTCWVDGREVPSRPDDQLPFTPFLSIQPASRQTGLFREITLSW